MLSSASRVAAISAPVLRTSARGARVAATAAPRRHLSRSALSTAVRSRAALPLAAAADSRLAGRWMHSTASSWAEDGSAGVEDSAGGAGGAGGAVVEVTKETFATEVMQSKIPVILDCYADWCGPCKQLTPILEDIANKSNGTLKLAKLNTDNQPELAQGLQVRSLPTVVGIVDGKIVDSFIGMQPPEKIQEFLGKIMGAAGNTAAGTGSEATLKEGQTFLESGDIVNAAQMFQRVIVDEEKNTDSEAMTLKARAVAGMIRAAVAAGDKEAIASYTEHLETVYASFTTIPEVAQTLAASSLLADAADSSAESGELLAKLEADPSDLDTRHQLAQQQFADGQFEEAINECLTIVKQDRTWNEGAGRTLLLKIFDAMGNDNPVVADGRRRLASILLV